MLHFPHMSPKCCAALQHRALAPVTMVASLQGQQHLLPGQLEPQLAPGLQKGSLSSALKHLAMNRSWAR